MILIWPLFVFGQRSQDHQSCLYDNSYLINSVSSTGKDSTKQHGSALLADEDPRQGPGWAECYPTWDLSGPSWLLIRGDHFGWCSVGGRCWGFGRVIGQVIFVANCFWGMARLWLSSRLPYPQRRFVEDPRIPKLHVPHPGSEIIPGYRSQYAYILDIYTCANDVYIYICNILICMFLLGRMLHIPYSYKKNTTSEASQTINPLFHEGIYAHLHIYIYTFYMTQSPT